MAVWVCRYDDKLVADLQEMIGHYSKFMLSYKRSRHCHIVDSPKTEKRASFFSSNRVIHLMRARAVLLQAFAISIVQRTVFAMVALVKRVVIGQ
jgi:hypothetical protein